MHDLWLGDCIEGMRALGDKSVDHVICDPPYEAEAHTKGRRILGGNGGRKSGMRDAPIEFAQITEADRTSAAREMVRVSRGWVLAFCQVEGVLPWRAAFEAAGGAWRRAGIWLKPDGMPQLTGDRPAQVFEMFACAWAGKGRSRWNGGGRGGVYTFCTNSFGRLYGTAGRPHPTMKPVALMEALVSDFTDPGELVMDPFAGSGTTGVACKRLGRNFIGFEKDPVFWAAAVKRIEAARQQGELFARGPKPKQARLLP